MEPERVPKSFGCLPHRNLKLSLSRSRSKSNSCSSSPRTPKSSSPSITPRKSSSRSKEDDQYREVFCRFDNDNDGKISALELRAYFGSIGEYMSHEDAQAMITYLDTDGDNLIDFHDFLSMMKKDNGDHGQDLKAAFEMFEFQKGSGRITPKSLQKVLSRLGDTKSYDECAAMIDFFDTDGKGELHFHEFQQMMTA
ncbi:hypothetical protein ACH5RR_011355 [Cinchona calisaya]|uniref:EF-hand domain-containing protein n=1 Tax=Cinchona calisaya TaxID=153742 RepID=A0ABD3A632_9GENT